MEKYNDIKEKIYFMQLQDNLEKNGITEENVKKMIKKLNYEQVKNLISLYKDQIANYEATVENYKKRIIKLKKQLG